MESRKFDNLFKKTIEESNLKRVRLRTDPAKVKSHTNFAAIDGYEGYILREVGGNVHLYIDKLVESPMIAIVPSSALYPVEQDIDTLKVLACQFLQDRNRLTPGIKEQLCSARSIDECEAILRGCGLTTEELAGIFKATLQTETYHPKTVEGVAKKHNVGVDLVKTELKKGTKIEKEHTDSADEARRIALDHLYERPDYYKKLSTCVEEGVGKVLKGAAKGVGKAIAHTADVPWKLDRLNKNLQQAAKEGPIKTLQRARRNKEAKVSEFDRKAVQSGSAVISTNDPNIDIENVSDTVVYYRDKKTGKRFRARYNEFKTVRGNPDIVMYKLATKPQVVNRGL